MKEIKTKFSCTQLCLFYGLFVNVYFEILMLVNLYNVFLSGCQTFLLVLHSINVIVE